MKSKTWLWLLGGGVVVGGVAALAGGGGKKGFSGAVVKPVTMNVPFFPTPDGSVQSESFEGEKTVSYTSANRAGTVGGLVAATQKDVPSVVVPVAGVPVVGAVVGELVKLVSAWAGGKLYPDAWTEPQGQLVELTAFGVPLDAPPSRISVLVTLQSGFEDEWYSCSRSVFNADNVNVSRVIGRPQPPDWFPQSSEKGKIACLYSRRQYGEAGLSVDVVPLPNAPGDIELHVKVSEEAAQRRVGLYLWLPPRLGKHRAEVQWKIWPLGD